MPLHPQVEALLGGLTKVVGPMETLAPTEARSLYKGKPVRPARRGRQGRRPLGARSRRRRGRAGVHAGVPIELVRYDGQIHGFVDMMALLEDAVVAMDRTGAAVRGALS